MRNLSNLPPLTLHICEPLTIYPEPEDGPCLSPEVRQWCEDSVEGHWHVEKTPCDVTISFEDREAITLVTDLTFIHFADYTAMLAFTLRWL